METNYSRILTKIPNDTFNQIMKIIEAEREK